MQNYILFVWLCKSEFQNVSLNSYYMHAIPESVSKTLFVLPLLKIILSWNHLSFFIWTINVPFDNFVGWRHFCEEKCFSFLFNLIIQITVPKDLVALMSAIGTGNRVHPQNPDKVTFTFTQKVHFLILKFMKGKKNLIQG